MGRRLIKQPNGRFAIFSTITDDFIGFNATPEEIVEFIVDEASKEARQHAREWVFQEGPQRFPHNRHTLLAEVLPTIRSVHGKKKADFYQKELTDPVVEEEEDLTVVTATFADAQREFPVGCKVEVTTERPEWNPGYPCDKVVCGHVRFRDSEDFPMICVTLVSYAGAHAGWFSPDNLKRVS